MLTILKYYLKMISIPIVFACGFGVSLASILKEAKWGLGFLIFLVSQPNIWYKFQGMPLGKDFLDIIFVSVCIGIFVQKTEKVRTVNLWLVILLIVLSYFSIWNSSIRFGLESPISGASQLLVDWKNFSEMLLLYFLTLNLVKSEEDQKVFITIISIVVLIISVRIFRGFVALDSFDYDRRAVAPFDTVGLGANHLGAFISQYSAAILGLLIFERNKRRRLLLSATCFFGIFPLLYSFSRGAYLAALAAVTFLGVFGRRILLVFVVAIIFSWQSILPPSVIDRINMTQNESGELEQSASLRVVLWEDAIRQFKTHPVVGIGFGGFNLLEHEGAGGLRDSHNYYVKVLAENGIIGFVLLITVLSRAFWSGFLLCNDGKTLFYKGLGFGFMACVVATVTTNLFGDRFSYFCLGSFFWVLWGLVDKGVYLSRSGKGKIFRFGGD